MAKSKLENKNPPRRTTIRGQDHLLAYITPEEAQLLMDNGGSGEAGPMGIPSFVKAGAGAGGPAGMGSKSMEGFGSGPDKGGDKGAVDPGLAKAVAEKAAQQAAAQAAAKSAELERISGLTPGQATAMFGDATMAGMGVKATDIDKVLGGATVDVTGILPELQARARRAQQLSTLGGAISPLSTAIKGVLGLSPSATSYDNLATLLGMPGATIQSGGLFGPSAVLAAPTGGTGAFGTPANLSQGYFGQVAYTGMPDSTYTGPFENLVNQRAGYMGRDGDIVPTQTNPVTGEQQCPDGYVFDADLQACRVAAPLPGVGETVGGTGFDYAPGTYARMGLLDVAPTGLEQFASTYGTGFGTPQEFEAANLAYRQPVATQASYFKDPYNLQGMTLLA